MTKPWIKGEGNKKILFQALHPLTKCSDRKLRHTNSENDESICRDFAKSFEENIKKVDNRIVCDATPAFVLQGLNYLCSTDAEELQTVAYDLQNTGVDLSSDV